jgi:hypothetical protein
MKPGGWAVGPGKNPENQMDCNNGIHPKALSPTGRICDFPSFVVGVRPDA